jgi:hypothetical protein
LATDGSAAQSTELIDCLGLRVGVRKLPAPPAIEPTSEIDLHLPATV